MESCETTKMFRISSLSTEMFVRHMRMSSSLHTGAVSILVKGSADIHYVGE
jgi:hypothetical protein